MVWHPCRSFVSCKSLYMSLWSSMIMIERRWCWPLILVSDGFTCSTSLACVADFLGGLIKTQMALSCYKYSFSLRWWSKCWTEGVGWNGWCYEGLVPTDVCHARHGAGTREEPSHFWGGWSQFSGAGALPTSLETVSWWFWSGFGFGPFWYTSYKFWSNFGYLIYFFIFELCTLIFLILIS